MQRRSAFVWFVIIMLAMSAQACQTLLDKGELPADGTSVEFGAGEEYEVLFRAEVIPGRDYRVVATWQGQERGDFWIIVCDEWNSDGSMSCYEDPLANDTNLSDGSNVRFTAPADGDVMIVITGPAFGSWSEDYAVTLTEVQ